MKSADPPTGLGSYEPGPTTCCAKGNLLHFILRAESCTAAPGPRHPQVGSVAPAGQAGPTGTWWGHPAPTDRVPRALAERGPEDPLRGAARVPRQGAEASFLLVFLRHQLIQETLGSASAQLGAFPLPGQGSGVRGSAACGLCSHPIRLSRAEPCHCSWAQSCSPVLCLFHPAAQIQRKPKSETQTGSGIKQLSTILCPVLWGQCHLAEKPHPGAWSRGYAPPSRAAGHRWASPCPPRPGRGRGRPPAAAPPRCCWAGSRCRAPGRCPAGTGGKAMGPCSAGGQGHPMDVSPGRGAGRAMADGRAHFSVLLSISPRVLAERLSLSSSGV